MLAFDFVNHKILMDFLTFMDALKRLKGGSLILKTLGFLYRAL